MYLGRVKCVGGGINVIGCSVPGKKYLIGVFL